VFPTRRSLDENGDKGLEGARLAYVGIAHAGGGAHELRRQPAGPWPLDQPAARPGFVDQLAIASLEAVPKSGHHGGGPGMRDAASRWDEVNNRSV
jgi:hypothetical protein